MSSSPFFVGYVLHNYLVFYLVFCSSLYCLPFDLLVLITFSFIKIYFCYNSFSCFRITHDIQLCFL